MNLWKRNKKTKRTICGINKAARLTAFLCIAVVVSLCLFTACAGGFERIPQENRLTFKDGIFKILQIADTHEWLGIEKGLGVEKKDNLKPLLLQYLTDVLESENPDLVVLSGDNVFCLSWLDVILGYSVDTYVAFADFFEGRGQYWTMTFGNHDSEGPKTKMIF
jgi:hypothetical protein